MSNRNTIVCTVGDHTKQTTTMRYPLVLDSWIDKLLDSNKRNEFKGIIEANSYAKVTSISQAVVEDYGFPEDPAWYKTSKKGVDLVDQKAVLIFRENATGKTHRMELPAPKEGIFEYVQKQGLRVTVAAGDAIAKKMTEIFGTPVQFMEGYHKGKK